MMQQINLYQPIFRKEKKVFSARAMLEVNVVMLFLLFAVYGLSEWKISRLDSDISEMQNRVQVQKDTLADLQIKFPVKNKDKLLGIRIADLERQLVASRSIVSILSGGGVHGNKAGFSGLLSGFAMQHQDGVWLDYLEIRQGGGQLVIKGKAESADIVPKYIQGLSREPVLRGMGFEMFHIVKNDSDLMHVDFSLSSVKEEIQ